MFDNLPVELFVKICDNLGIRDEYHLSLATRASEIIYIQRMQSRLAAVLSAPSSNQFIQFLTCIRDNEKDGLAILQDETCKKTLLEKRPKELPHWMLNIADCQPDLIPFLLKDEDYKNSLKPVEFSYLLRNYPDFQTFVTKHNITQSKLMTIEDSHLTGAPIDEEGSFGMEI